MGDYSSSTIRIVHHDSVEMEIFEMSKKNFFKDILPEFLGH